MGACCKKNQEELPKNVLPNVNTGSKFAFFGFELCAVPLPAKIQGVADPTLGRLARASICTTSDPLGGRG